MPDWLFNLLLVIAAYFVLRFIWGQYTRIVAGRTVSGKTKPLVLDRRSKYVNGKPNKLELLGYIKDNDFGWCQIYLVTTDADEQMYVMLSDFGQIAFYLRGEPQNVVARKPKESKPFYHLVLDE